jgi:hypothetical protein
VVLQAVGVQARFPLAKGQRGVVDRARNPRKEIPCMGNLTPCAHLTFRCELWGQGSEAGQDTVALSSLCGWTCGCRPGSEDSIGRGGEGVDPFAPWLLVLLWPGGLEAPVGAL